MDGRDYPVSIRTVLKPTQTPDRTCRTTIVSLYVDSRTVNALIRLGGRKVSGMSSLLPEFAEQLAQEVDRPLGSEGGFAQPLEIFAESHNLIGVISAKQVAARDLLIEDVIIGGIREFVDHERRLHARQNARTEGDDLNRHIRRAGDLDHPLQLTAHHVLAADK